MLIDVTMPQLGESVSEGTITKWLVGEGDVVQKDQPIAEIGTDKADSELPAPAAGRIAKILAHEGDVVPVKSVLCQLEEGENQSASASKGASNAPPSAQDARQNASATNAGAPPNRNASSPMASPTARRTALEHEVNLGEVQGSGEHGRITKDDVLRAISPGVVYAPPRTEPPRDGRFPANSPAPQMSSASGSASSATSADGNASASSARGPAAGGARGASGSAASLANMVNQAGGFVPPIPGLGYGAFKVPAYRPQEGDKVVPFTRRRRITADHMIYSKFSSPHVVTVAEVDLHKASQLREANKDRYKKEGLALTMLAFVVVATARALQENRSLNARVLDDAFVVFKDINIGVAVDSPDGLVVPVVRRADELGVRGIVRAVDELAKRAKTGKITIDDLSGSTFSVTNPGIKGNLFGGAIINQPNVGIVRMGEIQKRVVVVEGPDGEDHMAIHPVMYVALSYDHRIVDGVAANSFLWRVTEILEKAEFEV